MPKSSVPELQGKLFKSLGIDNAASGGKNGRGQATSRKDQRKANRVQKRTSMYSRNNPRQASSQDMKGPKGKQPVKKSSSSARRSAANHELSERSMDEDEDDTEDDDGSEGFLGPDDEDDEMHDFGESETEEVVSKSGSKGSLSRSAKEKLAQDDADIEAFEKKLGIKKGRKTLPQAFKDDGLDELMGDLGAHEDPDSDEPGDDAEDKKRKREYDDWLATKRQKTDSKAGRSKQALPSQHSDEDEDDEGEEDFDFDEEDFGDEDEHMEGDEGGWFGGFDSDDDEEEVESKPRVRENPYVAPSTGTIVAKYVPPSLRRAAGSEGDAHERLRKQSQGLINRLTDANILSIVKGVEELYQKNARGVVTEALTDVIISQICKPEALPDQFFVLVGGFSAAIYKVIGSSFGSHLVRRVVKDFGDEYDRARIVQNDESAIPKEPSNLLTFLSQLYVFEVVRCKIIFDYMERLLGDLTELNVELLLRICRNGGRLLRRDDPQSLKNVAGALSKSVSSAGSAGASVRTKFMVETINDLKNKKAKGKGLDSAVVSEHVVKMKKHLGELKSQSRRFEGATPMGIDLDDVLNVDTRGKWWLVGASVPQEGIKGKDSKSMPTKGNQSRDYDDKTAINMDEDEDMDFVLPDYPKKARSQGLTMPSQIAIFSALMTATNADSGWRQINNLGLKKDDKREVARVLVQCVGSEAEYNPYYAGVARLACGDGKLRFAFQSRLWQIFRAMGESLFSEEADDADSSDSLRFQDEQRIRKVAEFYASLMAEGSLSTAVLKPLTIPEMEPLTRTFMESLLIGLLQECKSKKPEKEDARVLKAFDSARDVPKLATGLEWFLREKLRKTKAVTPKRLKKLDEVKEKALAVLHKEDGFEDMEN